MGNSKVKILNSWEIDHIIGGNGSSRGEIGCGNGGCNFKVTASINEHASLSAEIDTKGRVTGSLQLRF